MVETEITGLGGASLLWGADESELTQFDGFCVSRWKIVFEVDRTPWVTLRPPKKAL